jgi:aldose 1-epimerase
MPGGAAVDLFRLVNGDVEIRTMPYGATIVGIATPDRRGQRADIALGFDTLDAYLTRSRYFGSVVGRYGNRIAKGRFTLDGRSFQLATNNGPNHLHGGEQGFDKCLWTAAPFERGDDVGVVYSYTSADGEEGYPGELHATVWYALTPRHELTIEYAATSSRATPVNLTQHSYFNLAGEGQGNILGHLMTIDADKITPVDATLIPTGELASVSGTPFDFRQPKAIGERIDADDEQLRRGQGYDHTFVLNGWHAAAPRLRRAARAVDPGSGRTLEVATTEPGVQFYSGNFLSGQEGKQGHVYAKRSGFCLETQHFPDSPNHPAFPSTILRPGKEYRTRTVFSFGVVP